MKKLLLTAIAACFAFGAASAQEPGQWAVGPRIGIYTHTGTQSAVLGIGATGRYAWAEHWRAEGNVLALCQKGSSLDVNVNAQYLFRLDRGWTIYPLAGVGLNNVSRAVRTVYTTIPGGIIDEYALYDAEEGGTPSPEVTVKSTYLTGKGVWSWGFNIGVGTDLEVSDRWDVTADVKWMIQTARNSRNPLVISIGAAYKF